jgi:hypothetical protein
MTNDGMTNDEREGERQSIRHSVIRHFIRVDAFGEAI